MRVLLTFRGAFHVRGAFHEMQFGGCRGTKEDQMQQNAATPFKAAGEHPEQ